jgi:hypothetical protein
MCQRILAWNDVMLVKFLSSTDGQLLMFADVAAPILRHLGKSPAPRGVLAADELPALLAALIGLRDGTPGGEPLPGDAHAAAAAAAHEIPVSLRQRVAPLIDLLQRTVDDEGYVLWEAPEDFTAD